MMAVDPWTWVLHLLASLSRYGVLPPSNPQVVPTEPDDVALLVCVVAVPFAALMGGVLWTVVLPAWRGEA